MGDEVSTVITWQQSLDPFVNWFYDIGCDGSIEQQVLGSTDGNTTFTFATAGTYTVCLIAESENGCMDEWQASITIAPALFSNFTVSDMTPCGIDTVLFSATSPAPGLSYEWIYGDGTSSGLGPYETSIYNYCDTGYFDITLNVSNNGCFTSSTIDSLIYVAAPIADFAINTNCTDYYTIDISNFSILPDTADIIWTFDEDTLYLGEWEPTHTFTSEGVHEVTQWVYNDSTGCADFKRRTVKINEPTFYVDIGPTTGCPPVIVNIEPLDIECVSTWNVQLEGTDFLSAQSTAFWDLDWQVNGNTGSPNNQPSIDWPSVVYGQLGTFDIGMTIVDVNGCQIDTLYEDIINVDIDPFFARFDSVVTRYCDSTVVCVSPEQSGLSNWQWTASNGQSSTTESSCFTFFPPYNQTFGEIITLTANDTGGCSSTVSDSLFFDPVTTACFTTTDSNPCKDELVQVDASCTTCALAPCTYSWDLDADSLYGDATGTMADFSFSENGVFDVSLLVEDDEGCQSTYVVPITVHSPEPVVLISQTIFACISTITIENLTTGPGISSDWNISDQHGCEADTVITDFLGYGEAVGDFNCILETQDCAPFTIECESFNANDSTFQYTWNMGDNTPYSTTEISHDYVTGGVYEVTLTMTDPDNNCTFSLESDPITVTELNWTFNGATTVCPGDSSLISITGLDSLIWESPLNSITQETATSWYLNPSGPTDFVAIAYDEGCLGHQTITVDEHMLPSYSVDPFGPFCRNAGDIGVPAVTPSGGSFFIDETAYTAINTTNLDSAFTQITYQLEDPNMCLSETTIDLLLIDTTTITLDLPSLCIGSPPVDLIASSSEGAGTFTFSYDGTTEETSSTFSTSSIVAYPDEATAYIINYEFLNADGCTSLTSDSLIVHPLPEASFIVGESCEEQEVVINQLSTVTSGSIASYEWTIEENGITTAVTPVDIVYEDFGEYDIALEVITDAGCQDSFTDTIRVHPNPIVSAMISDACRDDEVILNNNFSISDGFVDEVEIFWGDSSSELNAYSQVGHDYQNAGNYSVLVTALSDQGCTDTDSLTLTVFPEPVAGGQMDSHCFDLIGTALDTSTISSGNITSVDWTIPSENVNFSGTSFDHQFSAPGMFDIEQIVVSDFGCIDSTTTSVTVHDLPMPQYALSEESACTGAELTLFDISTVPAPYTIDSTIWVVNGSTLTGEEVAYSFPLTQFVDVSLQVFTNEGCSAQVADENVVQVIAKPVSSFYVTPSELTIAENVAHFIDESQFANIWEYQLEDGTRFITQNASHTFDKVGEYSILQIVENEIGCLDSSWQFVKVLPTLLVYVPTAVSMDGDGFNDQFFAVISGDEIEQFLLRIFDRNGHVVFETNDPNEPWNGSVKGGDYYAKDDVYNWQLIIKGVNGPLERIVGMVTVLR